MSIFTTRALANGSGDTPYIERAARGAGGHALERDTLLTTILRRRRRPLLLVIDSDGELLYSSVPESAPASEQRLLGQALGEARSLFHWQDTLETGEDDRTRSVIDGQGQRSVLVALGNEFFSLRVMRLHGTDDGSDQEEFAALVEPIVEPLTKDIDFDRVKLKYRLSNREGDVLEALMTGQKDKEIAQRTGLTTGTVRSYLKSIRAKLGVTTRTAIVNVVHEFGSEESGSTR
jgi:DNA-binding CsgD family transcriptional regulator